MEVLIVSDFHIGKGRYFRNGQINILEDFFEDQRFIEFLDYYSSKLNYWKNIHLVLGGDILNLIQVDFEGSFSYVKDEAVSINAVKDIVEGHRQFFDGLKKFISSPNKKITYIIGNHDSGMVFPGAQAYFREVVEGSVDFAFNVNIHGVYVEHGHRFEAINSVPATNHFLTGPMGQQILNLPWGSLFCLSVLPRLKKLRPSINRIRPVSVYITWCLFNDIAFFFMMAHTVIKYFIQTRHNDYVKQNSNFKTTLKLLKQITIYPRYGKMARSIMKRNRSIKAVVMGHTHIQEWRRFSDGRYYFNTGTWNSIPSVDAGMHDSDIKLTYVRVEIDEKKDQINGIYLNQWKGSWNPYREEVSTTINGQ